jgi:uncharacterized phage protein (TIGR01671 family)
MHEILFRGKKISDGKWVYGLLTLSDGKAIIQTIPYGTRSTKYVVQPDTIGQYTGIIDKNGKKIFECDIVRRKTLDDSFTGVVEFKAPKFQVRGEKFDVFIEDLYSAYEKIGNIHDNPELLGDK